MRIRGILTVSFKVVLAQLLCIERRKRAAVTVDVVAMNSMPTSEMVIRGAHLSIASIATTGKNYKPTIIMRAINN